MRKLPQKRKPFAVKPMTPAEMVKRLTGIQSGVWQGRKFKAVWVALDGCWDVFEPADPEHWDVDESIDYFTSLTKYLNRFYDNRENQGPKFKSKMKAQSDAISLVS